MMEKYDLIIIGGGPGGYTCAERAADEGMKTALFEERKIGGTCLNEGCIPSKAFLNSAKLYRHATESKNYGVKAENVTFDHARVLKRKDKVVRMLVGGVEATLEAKGVTRIMSAAAVTGKNEDGSYAVKDADGNEYCAQRLVIASGSEAVMPPIPGVKEGFERGFVMTNREILALAELPNELVVVGGGVIGLEMACYYASVGVHVIIVEMLDKIAGATDRDICKVLMDAYAKRGMEFNLSTKLLEVRESSVLVEKDGEQREIPCDKVLMSVGRRARTAGTGIDTIGVATERGCVITDDHMLTNVQNVYAIGDCNGKVMLAHTAVREAEVAVNCMAGKEDSMSYDTIPSVIYTDPEVACVGETKEAAQKRGVSVREVVLPMQYAGRYLAETDNGRGFCKIVVSQGNGKILGIHMAGSYVSEIILAAHIMLDKEYSLEEIKKFIYPHPTVGEILKETILCI